ncbi:MAG: DMT family transporter [Acidobacteriota bacterium]
MTLDGAPTDFGSSYWGEVACLLSALLWAIAVAWFHGAIERYGAWSVNLAKNVLATLLLAATTLLVGQMALIADAPIAALASLAAAGIVGLTIGDTALFAAVSRLGVHRALLLQTFGPVVAAGLAHLAFDERLGPMQAVGSVLVLGGVALVVGRPADGSSASWTVGGAVLGLVSAAGQGSGVVLAKSGLEALPVLPGSLVRLTVASLGLALVMVPGGRLRAAVQALADREALRRIGGPTLIGTYLGFIVMMAGVAWAPASVAAVLIATPPIFSLFLDARFFGNPITARGLLGTAVAVSGVAFITAA